MIRVAPAAVLLAACFGPSYPEGLPCSDLQNCPPGQFCDLDALRCVKMELPGDLARPELVTGPRHPSGWIDEAGDPLRLELAPGEDGVRFECRTGPSSMVADLEFAACDGDGGEQPFHEPAPLPGFEEGSYETQARAVKDDQVSSLLVVPFYVHHSLDQVATCAPALSDEEVFGAARGAIETTGAFADDTAVDNPFLTLPFEDIIVTQGQADGSQGKWSVEMTEARLELASLRRRFALDEARELLLVQRQYESRRAREVTGAHVCQNGFRFGGRALPTGGGHLRIDCENLVLNRRGQGVCVLAGEGGAELGPTTDLGYAKLAQRGVFSPKGSAECPDCPWYLLIPE